MNDLMKLGSMLAFCYVVVYIVASAFGQQPTATPTMGSARNYNAPGGSNAYRGIYSAFGARRARKYYNPEVTAPDADSDQSGGAYIL